MEDGQYQIDVVNIFPETQLLVFKFPENTSMADLEVFSKQVRELFSNNPRLRLIVVACDLEIAALDNEDLQSIGLYDREDLALCSAGELASLALSMNEDQFPLLQISEALRNGDSLMLKQIKQELQEKVRSGQCPLCGSFAT